MELHIIDFIIIGTYLLATIVIGFVLKKKAQENKKSYLLGGIRCHGTCWVYQTHQVCLIFQVPCG